jgi:outer membrane protein OmpA-like peptidoglycan-associated protein
LVTATGGSGAAADYSAFTNLIPASVPVAPTVSITDGSDSITAKVIWVGGSGNGSPITGYNVSVTKNGSSTSCTGGNTSASAGSECEVTGVGGDVFVARVSAQNLVGYSETTTSSTYALIGTVDTPTAVTGTPGNGTATISFTQNANGDTVDDYEYSLDGGVTFISLGDNSSPVVISGLTNGTTYSIVIRGIGRTNGAGPESATITVTPAVPPAPPAPAPSSDPDPVPVVVKVEEKPKPTIPVITKETKSTESPVVAIGVDAIKDSKKFDSYFATPTTPATGTTPTTPVVTPITAANIVVVSPNTSVNSQAVKTTSDKPVNVPITLTAPIITDEVAKALSTKVIIESSASNLKITAVDGFTGIVIVPVVATVNGVQTTVLNRVVVSPVLPEAKGFAPVDIGKSSIAWQASTSQVVSYEVAVNGKVACTTTTTSCPLPALIGPKTKVTVNAIGNDETTSGPQVIPYTAVKPIPALKVNFTTGSAVLTAGQKREIAAIAKVINTQGFTRLVVNGFTDATGSPALNAALSKARAASVVTYMKTLLPEVAVKAGANGPAKPVASNKTDNGRAQNRRTEIATW